MSTLDSILRELREAPEPVLRRVLDFLKSLKSRSPDEGFDTAIASEPALAEEWNRPEEDEAWRDL